MVGCVAEDLLTGEDGPMIASKDTVTRQSKHLCRRVLPSYLDFSFLISPHYLHFLSLDATGSVANYRSGPEQRGTSRTVSHVLTIIM